jgi:hypothetical protein
MTSRSKTTDEEYEKLMSGSGKKQTTLSKEKSVLSNFKKYLAEDKVELEDIKDDTEALSKYVGKYLNNIRVPKSKEDNTLVRPKLGYFNVSYSHLKTGLRFEIFGFFFFSRYLKKREEYLSFAHFVYFLREACYFSILE